MTPSGAVPGRITTSRGQLGWRALATLFAAVHVSYVLFVLFGGFLVRTYPALIWLHLGAVAWAAATMIGDLGCPVTTWEKDCLRRSGREPYPEGFLQHHLLRTRFDPGNTRRNHTVLGAAAILLNLAVYLL